MLASFLHKFIFVKGRKVASTSIEMALAPYCGPSDIVTPITPADEYDRLEMGGKCQNFCNDTRIEARYLQLVRNRRFEKAIKTRVHSSKTSKFYNHMPLLEIESKLNIPFDQYVLIISERNPYTKIISLANMDLAFADYQGDVMESSWDDIRRSITKLFRTGRFRDVRNVDLYRSEQRYQELIVLRQESLGTGLADLFKQLGLGVVPQHWPHAKKGTMNRPLRLEDIFTREQLDLVNQEFAEEFQLFGYDRI